MNYNIISTGSQGNAVVLNNIVLIDCGVPFKVLKDVYRNLKIVLLTHKHIDHFCPATVKKLSQERPTLRFVCCDWLVAELIKAGVNPANLDLLKIGTIYDYKEFKISPVKLYHDVKNCGYRLFFGDKKAIYITDTHTVDGITAKNYDLYLIESNYEEEELQERIRRKMESGQYCYELNVASRHLSKEQADRFLLENMGENSRYEYLHYHESREVEKNEKNGKSMC